ncbi:MAG: Xaa-Pro peptidase family protein [Actinomycetota bacterium]|nr:Xaa-Pro peptidase family protein [Actinomycetota bacterium]
MAGLPPMDVPGRLPRLREQFDGAGCDSLVVSHLVNIRYLTGFTGSAALLVVRRSGAALVTDGRYTEQAQSELAAAGTDAEVLIGRTRTEQRELVAGAVDGVRLGLEADHVSWAAQRTYDDEWFPDQELVATTGIVERLRAVKDDGEVARIERACRIADDALLDVRDLLGSGVTERGFAARLDQRIRELGAEDISFETIVASGPNGSRPHHQPADRVIEHGDLVTIDFGALVDGYHSDMTRTLAVGGLAALDDVQRRLLEVVTEAQAAGVAAVGPEVAVKVVDRACRQVIGDAGWGDHFVHGTGHGVGLDIHEDPPVSANADATLAPGHIVTVEPGVYLPGIGGVRVEDTVVVTAEGCRPLTRAPKS